MKQVLLTSMWTCFNVTVRMCACFDYAVTWPETETIRLLLNFIKLVQCGSIPSVAYNLTSTEKEDKDLRYILLCIYSHFLNAHLLLIREQCYLIFQDNGRS